MEPKRPEAKKIVSAATIERALAKNPFEKLSSIVFLILEDAILRSELSPGEKLNVTKLAAELEVSPTPVREAIEQLLARGLVTSGQRGDGKYSNYYVFDITNESIQDLFVARKSIEGTSAFLCAQKNWRVKLPELGRLAEDFQNTLRGFISRSDTKEPELSVTAELDRQFHQLLVESTCNEFLISMYAIIGKKLEYLSYRTNQFLVGESNTDNLLLLGNQHISIYRAVKFGFPELARSCMDEHIDFCLSSCLQNRNLILSGKQAP